LLFQIVT
ncbi:Heme exporter protein C, partial [Haemophilus influenzae]